LELLETLPGGVILNLLAKVLVTIGSSASIGLGIWHFFVPEAWKWYSYIDINATELVAAVRAINVFFSLSLVLFGIINLLFIYGDKSNRYSIIADFGEIGHLSRCKVATCTEQNGRAVGAKRRRAQWLV
jgi:hypothetical protein